MAKCRADQSEIPLLSPDRAEVLLRNHRPGARLANLSPLAGDASNRRYYRLSFKADGVDGSAIVMELASAEGFKQSEEKVTGTVAVDELPYLNLQRYLAKAGVAVPSVLHDDSKSGLVLIEDLGDETLEFRAGGAGRGELRQLYVAAVGELLKLQIAGTAALDEDCMARHRAFDSPLLIWEFEHFLEFGLPAGTTIRPSDRKAITSHFRQIAEELAAIPRLLVHRDYHSRNLMITGGRVRPIDFQDALLGPRVYDLASLLRDSYLELPEDLVDSLVAWYLQQFAARSGLMPDQPGPFRRQLDLMSIQRNLKAAGRFGYIDQVKKNDRYLQYIPRTLDYVAGNLAKYPELQGLAEVLGRYVPALRPT